MMVVDPFRSVSPRWFAIAALACFAPVVATFAFAPGAWWKDYPGILFHLAMFMLVNKLDAPEWAKAAGYGWLFLDVTTGVLTLNGMPTPDANLFRYGGHIFAGIWILVASLSGTRAMKILGAIIGVWMTGYTFVSPFLSAKALAPASLLYLIWLAVVAWQNGGQGTTRDTLAA